MKRNETNRGIERMNRNRRGFASILPIFMNNVLLPSPPFLTHRESETL